MQKVLIVMFGMVAVWHTEVLTFNSSPDNFEVYLCFDSSVVEFLVFVLGGYLVLTYLIALLTPFVSDLRYYVQQHRKQKQPSTDNPGTGSTR